MKNVLWISPFVPYDSVNHAGGKTENFYIKGLKKRGINIKLLSFCTENEVNNIDLNEYGIDYDVFIRKTDFLSRIKNAIKYNNFESKFNYFNKYANFITNSFVKIITSKLSYYKSINYYPDIIFLEWTETVLIIDIIKDVFPNSLIYCFEEDVSYLSYERFYNYEKNKFLKIIRKHKFEVLKRIELLSLSKSDKIFCYNEKDKKLLVNDGIPKNKIICLPPYFNDYSYVIRGYNQKCKIIFFGSMSRVENYLSAIWFIENVIPLLDNFDFEFDIIGANPPEKLQKYESNNVHILGYIEDVSNAFSDCTCLAAPLVLGAGIKVKILECMSAGIPVLTNEIGIEGIPAKSEKDFIFCKSPIDYATAIKQIYFSNDYASKIGSQAKKFINSNYNLEKSLNNLNNLINISFFDIK